MAYTRILLFYENNFNNLKIYLQIPIHYINMQLYPFHYNYYLIYSMSNYYYDTVHKY